MNLTRIFAAGAVAVAALASPRPTIASDLPNAAAWQAWDSEPLLPQEYPLFADAQAHRPIQQGLLSAALVAGGTSDSASIARYQGVLEHYCRQFRPQLDDSQPPARRAARLFELMHAQILTAGYQEDMTDLAATFDSGRYNCVSSCVLFNCLAQRCGLQVGAVEYPSHVCSLLQIGQQRLAIENTCPTWFRSAELKNTTLTDGALSAGRQVDTQQLAAIVYYNRGIDLLGRQQFSAAISANLRALRLDPASPTAASNLLAAVNNWSLALCDAGQFAEASQLLRRARGLAPDHEPFRANSLHVAGMWCHALAQQGRFEDASAVIAAARDALGNDARLDRLQADLRRRQLGHGT